MVKYLVESQMGGYYVTDVNPLDVHRSSDTYDGLDTIITYWDDIDQDYMMKQLKIALMRRFNSDSNVLRDIVENNYEVRDASLTEVVEDIIWFSESTAEDNEYLLDSLVEDKVIDDNQREILSNLNKRLCNIEKKLIRNIDMKSIKRNIRKKRKR